MRTDVVFKRLGMAAVPSALLRQQTLRIGSGVEFAAVSLVAANDGVIRFKLCGAIECVERRFELPVLLQGNVQNVVSRTGIGI